VRRALLLSLLAALCSAAPASAHSVMKVESGTIHYTANDDVSLNDLSVTVRGSDLRFYDPGADGGITPAAECAAGAETDNQGNPVEVFCPRSGITTLRIDVGEAQDKVTVQLPLAVLVLGGRGADTVTTGDGADVVNGGEANDTIRTGNGNDQLVGDVGDDQLFGEGGDDTLQGAQGADTVDAGAGNDTVRVRDGAVDRGTCGDGNDSAQADAADVLDACEAVDKPEGDPAPPPDGGGGGPAPLDTAAPRVRAGGSTLQRVGRSGRLTVLATVSEVAEVVGGGYVTIGERRFAFRAARTRVGVGGGGVRLRLTLARKDARRLWRLLRGRRKAVARVSVVATDEAGNSASKRLPRIAVRR
jgi:Ca2+-binding RTX toxin-like protein